MESDVRVISGTRRQIRELVDGSLEVRIHIDPRFKADFHRLFPSIDMPCALAPLVPDFQRIELKQQGPLCKLAAIWCKDSDFQTWIADSHSFEESGIDEQAAADFVRHTCSIDSRSELDHNTQAGAIFHEQIREPFMHWLRMHGK